MALKDIWTNKTDGVDEILADDINAIANEAIANSKNKADKVNGLGLVFLDENYQSDEYQECCRMGVSASNYSKSINTDIIFYDAPQMNRRLATKADKAEIPTKVSELENDTNYVTNTDYATAEVGGVVKVSNYSDGLFVKDNGALGVYGAEKSVIKAKKSWTAPITPVNLDYAVEVCTNQTMSYDNTEAQGQLPASYDAVKTYVDDGLTSKADKTDLDWKLIGEVTTDKEAESVVLDLREPITKWYSETMIRVEIPKCKDLGSNASISSGKLRVMFGNTPEQAVGGSGFLPISNSQTNNNLVTPSKDKEQGYVITSVWKDKENIDYSYIGFRSEGASNGYVNTPYFTYVKDGEYTTRSIINRQYLGLHCFYGTYVDGVEVKTFCTFPQGTKMALYGRI